MTKEEVYAKLLRADKLAGRLQGIKTEIELEVWVNDMIYALVSRLDATDRDMFYNKLHDTQFYPSFESHVAAIADVLDYYKEFISKPHQA